MKVRCLIVDDEPIAQDILESYIGKVEGLELVGKCNNAMEAINLLRQEKVDLMFLDIQMPGLSGISMLKTLKDPPRVIFTTAYREYAVESYELDVMDYLLKPIPFERFLTAVNKYFQEQTTPATPATGSDTDDYLFLSVDKRMVKVIIGEILYIESQRDYIRIVTTGDELLVHRNISFAEDRLPQDKFIRIHRSFMVAIDRIEAYSSSSVTIGGKDIPIGRNYKNEVLEVLSRRFETW
jgi:DNA-binding LytR/AlgR family response regulator